jgi:hypothetical protein
MASPCFRFLDANVCSPDFVQPNSLLKVPGAGKNMELGVKFLCCQDHRRTCKNVRNGDQKIAGLFYSGWFQDILPAGIAVDSSLSGCTRRMVPLRSTIRSSSSVFNDLDTVDRLMGFLFQRSTSMVSPVDFRADLLNGGVGGKGEEDSSDHRTIFPIDVLDRGRGGKAILRTVAKHGKHARDNHDSISAQVDSAINAKL